jgi:GntR family transcriptional regulator
MTFEYTPPKYAQIIRTIQERIESGEYPAGSLLPSEHQLTAEFGTARPTVVRALRVLRGDGWIETQQGKGSFVRGRPALAGVDSTRRGQAELDRDETREPGELISSATCPAPARVAARLRC